MPSLTSLPHLSKCDSPCYSRTSAWSDFNPNANGVSLISCRSRTNCQSDKNIKCNRASMQHTSSTRLLLEVRIVWKHQGSLRSDWLTCIWRRENQWIRAWRTHRPSVCMMESWVRFSSQSQAKERVFRYTNTHCMHAYMFTALPLHVPTTCFLDILFRYLKVLHWKLESITVFTIYLTISKTNNKAQWYSHVFGYYGIVPSM